MADNASLYKLLAKSLGMQHGSTSCALPATCDVLKHSVLSHSIFHGQTVQQRMSSLLFSSTKRLSAPPQLPGTSGHIHVSLRDKQGNNVFALSKEDIDAGGRKDAANDDLKWVSKEAEHFLAGLLDGLVDGK